jgi:transporter family-2 protein
MGTYVLGILVALVSGVCICFQGVFNSVLQRHIGLIGIMCWIHLTGFVLSIPLVILYKPDLLQSVSRAFQGGVPVSVILSGALGLVIVPGIAYAITRTNAAATFSVLVVGQLLLSLVFQRFGLLGMAQQEIGAVQLAACGLVAAGTGLFFIPR